MLVWRDGIARAPCRHEAREIPQRSVWAQSLWITRKGVVWKRVYNAISKKWTWTERAPLIFDQEGTRQGLNIPHFVPLDLLIARAWRMRKPGSATKVNLRDGVQPTAKTLQWQEEDEDFTDEIPGEEWVSLQGCKIGLAPCNPDYQISSYARLKTPDGEITSGHWWDGRFWAHVAGAGMLDLTSAAKKRKTIVVPPSIEKAMDALRTGIDPADYAIDRGIKETSAWSAYTTAAPHLPPSILRRACREILPPELWNALTHMKKNGDQRLGARLTGLLEVIDEDYLPGFAREPLRFEMLRLGKMGILS